MSVKWAISAQKDLLEISQYLLTNEDEKTAELISQKILDSAKILYSFPLSGRIGRIEGTRETKIQRLPYVLVYQCNDGYVEIVRIFHTSRLFPETLE